MRVRIFLIDSYRKRALLARQAPLTDSYFGSIILIELLIKQSEEQWV